MKRLAYLGLLCVAALPAETIHLDLDPAQTKVEYQVSSTLHTVHGTFQLKRGAIQFDPVTGQSSGEMIVDAASGASGTAARDRKMHKEVLESTRYPEIVFRPDRVDGKVAAEGASQVQFHGIFSIHGADHEMTVPVDVKAGNGEYAAIVHFEVPYIKWGMKNPSTFVLRVSDTVEITVETTARMARETARN